MTTFQVSFSPPIKKSTLEKTSENVEVVPRLILAPFNVNAEIKFGEVIINSAESRSLSLFNPGKQMKSIEFTNLEIDDRITLSENKLNINHNEHKLVVLTWAPIHCGYLRKVIRVRTTGRMSQSFEVVLCGTAINKNISGKKKLNIVNNKNAQSSRSVSEKERDLRRETFSVNEKENRQPICRNINPPRNNTVLKDESLLPIIESNVNENIKNITGSHYNTTDNYDNVDAPAKYSNFEMELNVSELIENIQNNETPAEVNIFPRRSTMDRNSIVSNVNSLSVITNKFDFTLGNTTFDLKSCKEEPQDNENVFLTPPKTFNFDSILDNSRDTIFVTPMSVISLNNFTKTMESETSFLSCLSSRTMINNNLIVISPPDKRKFLKPRRKTPDHFIHHIGSSAIKDRRRHIRTSSLAKKLPSSPKHINVTRITNNINRLRTQNSSFLKRVVSAQCHIEDPFLKQLVYNDDDWIDDQEKEIIKWMNSILVRPTIISEDNNDWTVDGVEAWLQRNNIDTTVKNNSWSINKMPTFYNTPENLNILRKRRTTIYEDEYVQGVFSELTNIIKRKFIYVREGRDICADEGIKNKLLELLGCYNSIWLRMGLEAIFQQDIPLQPKAEGLRMFIRKNFIIAKPNIRMSEKEKNSMREKILLRFLQLIFFMDHARTRNMIPHNGCLFNLNSKYKTSQDLLNAFCVDLVTGKSYIMKQLKGINYVLLFKQTCIDEYDYTITSLKDLNDGVRLSRLFEILFNERDICSRLRVPAVDIENKKFNIEVAMRVAKKRCTIEGNITSEDFVLANRLGSRVKILSFLWQIINNYLAPLYAKNATKIQRWWRETTLHRRLLAKFNRNRCARILQRAWRSYREQKVVSDVLENARLRTTAAVFIQTKFRATLAMRKERALFIRKVSAVIIMQSSVKAFLQRKQFLKMKSSAIIIQQHFRAVRSATVLHKDFLSLKSAAIIVQRLWRAKIAMKRARLENAAVCIQRKMRSKIAMKKCRFDFIRLKEAAVNMQKCYRAKKSMQMAREHFARVKNAVIVLQRRYRATKMMQFQRNEYMKLKQAVIITQSRFRANKFMQKERKEFSMLKSAAITIQKYFRAHVLMKSERQNFNNLKKAALILQTFFRARRLMLREKDDFAKMKQAVVFVQSKFRANKLMKHERNEFLNFKNLTILIQRRFRANVMMKKERVNFLKLKKAAIVIQNAFKMKKIMQRERENFVSLKRAVIFVQSKFRVNRLTRHHKLEYFKMKSAAILIQRHFKALLMMKCDRERFLTLKNTATILQRRFRAQKSMKHERRAYLLKKHAAVVIQQRFRAYRLMKQQRTAYIQLKKSIITMQRRVKATIIMKIERAAFQNKKKATITIQRHFRYFMNRRITCSERSKYLKLRQSVLVIQRAFRANKEMQIERDNYTRLKIAATKIQTWYRDMKKTLNERNDFLKLKQSAVIIQRHFRALQLMRTHRKEYIELKSAVFRIQSRFFATRVMKIERQKYCDLRNNVVYIQRKYRAKKQMVECRKKYQTLKAAVVKIQSSYRCWNQMLIEKKSFNQLKNSAIVIQKWYRSIGQMKKFRNEYVVMKEMTLFVQRQWRAKIMYRKFLQMRDATLKIQKWWRKQLRIKRLKELTPEDLAAIKIQAFWRGYIYRKKNMPKKIPKKEIHNSEPPVTLRERYLKAINQLKTSDLYNVITVALWELEYVTSFSDVLCEGVAAEGIIPIIFNLLVRGNRSEPSLEIYRGGVSILINLVLHYKTFNIVLTSVQMNDCECLMRIIQIMQMTYDKQRVTESNVFRHCVTFMWILCQNSDVSKIIVKTPLVHNMLKKMLDKLLRTCDCSKKSNSMRINKVVPRTTTNWYANSEGRIFDDNCFAMSKLYDVLYS